MMKGQRNPLVEGTGLLGVLEAFDGGGSRTTVVQRRRAREGEA
jgi:hypothetical protein